MDAVLAFLASDGVRQFIHEHMQSDPQKLLLNPPAEYKEHIRLIADQIISRKKAKNKLPGWLSKEMILFPPPISVEQSSSEEAALYKRSLLSGEQLIDLTGGMGVDCMALSQNFQNTTYVEQNEWLCRLFWHNQSVLSVKEIVVENTTAEEHLKKFSGKACFFIDPARRDMEQRKVFRFADCAPDITRLLPYFQKKADRVLVKAAPLIDLTQGVSELQFVTEIHVLSIKNEVKEVLFLLDFKRSATPKITCVNLDKAKQVLEFTLDEERTTEARLGEVKNYLYDPNTSILKAGAFKTIASRYGLEKLGTSTHLYTSEMLEENFPGRRFEVLHVSVGKKDIQRLFPDGKANVITKNYPLNADELKKKLKLKDGGESFLIGYRDRLNKPVMVVAKGR